MPNGFYFDGNNYIPCQIIRRGRNNTRIRLVDEANSFLVPTESVSTANEDAARRTEDPKKIIPIIALERLYRRMRKITGGRAKHSIATQALLNERHGPKNCQFLTELMKRSLTHSEFYSNVGEGFYSDRANTRIDDHRFARQVVERLGNGSTLISNGFNATFVDYEVYPFRSTYSCDEHGKRATNAGSGGMDLLLARTTGDQTLPVVGEIKAKTEGVGPTFALIQSLMYSAQIATIEQFKRIHNCYREAFGNLNIDQPRVDIAIIIEAGAKLSALDLNYAMQLAADMRQIPENRIRDIIFTSCEITDTGLEFRHLTRPS